MRGGVVIYNTAQKKLANMRDFDAFVRMRIELSKAEQAIMDEMHEVASKAQTKAASAEETLEKLQKQAAMLRIFAKGKPRDKRIAAQLVEAESAYTMARRTVETTKAAGDLVQKLMDAHTVAPFDWEDALRAKTLANVREVDDFLGRRGRHAAYQR